MPAATQQRRQGHRDCRGHPIHSGRALLGRAACAARRTSSSLPAAGAHPPRQSSALAQQASSAAPRRLTGRLRLDRLAPQTAPGAALRPLRDVPGSVSPRPRPDRHHRAGARLGPRPSLPAPLDRRTSSHGPAWGRGAQHRPSEGPRKTVSQMSHTAQGLRLPPWDSCVSAHEDQPRQVVTTAPDCATNSQSRLRAHSGIPEELAGRDAPFDTARRRRSLRGTSPHGLTRTIPTRRKPSHERI